MLICTDDEHNKFYDAKVTQIGSGFELTKRWGRIGTKGQTKQELFSDKWTAESAKESILNEKLWKGYEATTPEALTALIVGAKTLGTAHKIEEIKWFVRKDTKLIEIKPENLHDPNLVPVLFVSVLQKNTGNQKSKGNCRRRFIIDEDGWKEVVFSLRESPEMLITPQPDFEKDKFLKKLQEAFSILLTHEYFRENSDS